MKTIALIVLVVLMLIEIVSFANLQTNNAKSEEIGMAVDSAEEAAGIAVLSFLAYDPNDKVSIEVAKSYLETQLGFDPESEQDQKDKEKIRKMVDRYVNGEEGVSEGIIELNSQLERHIPNDKERNEHQAKVFQKIDKLHKDSIKVFYGTKAYWKIKYVQNLIIEEEK